MAILLGIMGLNVFLLDSDPQAIVFVKGRSGPAVKFAKQWSGQQKGREQTGDLKNHPIE
jgi:hypothetical protein